MSSPFTSNTSTATFSTPATSIASNTTTPEKTGTILTCTSSSKEVVEALIDADALARIPRSISTPPVMVPVNAENAQDHFSRTACLFVGNLHKSATREALVYILTLRFSKFGDCWVKVVRTHSGDTIGFVQYMYTWDAGRALRNMHGEEVLGRKIRVAPKSDYRRKLRQMIWG